MKRICINRLMNELQMSFKDAEAAYREICENAAEHGIFIEQELDNYISCHK